MFSENRTDSGEKRVKICQFIFITIMIIFSFRLFYLQSKKEIQSMLSLCIQNLDEINFFRPKEKRPKMIENLRNIFYKMDLSDKETRILSGVFASLGKKR